jgi:hypothetical protein
MRIKSYLPLTFAVAVAACTEQPLGLETSRPLFDHSPPEWANTSFDLHDVTDLAAVANGSNVTLTWTSEDNYTNSGFFSGDGGDLLTKWHFEVYRRDNGAAVPQFDKVVDTSACSWNAGASRLECEYVDSALADGSYSYVVKAFAREGSPPDQETHHSHDSNTANVVVGATAFEFRIFYRFPPTGLHEARKFNRNGGTWNFQFVVEVKNQATNSWDAVSDCTTFPIGDIAFQGLWASPTATSGTGSVTGCEVVGAFNPDRASYTASISNANQQNVNDTAGTFVFTIDSTTNQNTVAFQGVTASAAD